MSYCLEAVVIKSFTILQYTSFLLLLSFPPSLPPVLSPSLPPLIPPFLPPVTKKLLHVLSVPGTVPTAGTTKLSTTTSKASEYIAKADAAFVDVLPAQLIL